MGKSSRGYIWLAQFKESIAVIRESIKTIDCETIGENITLEKLSQLLSYL